MSLKNAYTLKCEDLCTPAHAAILRQLDANEAPGADARALRLNGNSQPFFHSRISTVQLTALCEALATDTTVEFLDLSFNDATPATKPRDQSAATFGDAGAKIVARLLKMNKALKYVVLEGNAIGAAGAAMLADALSSGRGGGAGLEVLNLASNPVSDQGAEALAAMLRKNTTLRMLDVGCCDLCIKGLLALTAAVANDNTTLQTLGLEDCQVQTPPQQQTVRRLAQLLATNKSLKQLYLSKHQISDFDLEVLVADGFSRNGTLNVLDLKANRLSPLAAPTIALLLTCGTPLQVLSLHANRIGDDGAAAIAEAMPLNPSLVELDLRSCGIGDIGLELLAKAIVLSPSMAKVWVWGNSFGRGAAAAWRDLAAHVLAHGLPVFMDIEPYEVDGVPMIALSHDDDA